MKKVSLILFIFILILAVYPSETNAGNLRDIMDTGNEFLNDATDRMNQEYAAYRANPNENPRPIGVDGGIFREATNIIYNVFLTVGIVLAVIIAAVLGIQFMVGSVDEKAKVKESLLPFVIGCVIVFGAFGIWSIIINIGNNITG